MNTIMKSKFHNLLKEKWNLVFEQNSSKFRNHCEFKISQIGKYYKIYNEEFFLNKNQIPEKNSENSLLMRPFNPDEFNFNQIEDWQKLLTINDDMELSDTDEEGGFHQIIVNISPLCRNHCMIVPYPFEELPQVLGPEMLEIICDFMHIEHNSDFRISYNSWNAAASVNHLHFHIVYCSNFKEGLQNLPIENTPMKKLFGESDHNNDYNGIELQFSENYPLKFYCLKRLGDDEESMENFLNAANIMIKLLLSEEIPHNLIFSDNGKSVYFLPRKSYEKQSYLDLTRMAWLEISGICLTRSEEAFEKLSENIFEDILSSISLSKNEFESLSQSILKCI